MKKLISVTRIASMFLIFLTIQCGYSAYAQSYSMSYYVERTIMSPKIGFSFGGFIENRIEVGGFIQMNAEELSGERGYPIPKENIFYGTYLEFPIMVKKYFEIRGNIRAGKVNHQYFSITPAVHFDFKPISKIRVGMGIGTRVFRPTLLPRLTLLI